jgi:hypothetical protein
LGAKPQVHQGKGGQKSSFHFQRFDKATLFM